MAPDPSLADAAWSDCEVVIKRFEDAWRGGTRPDLASFLTPLHPRSPRLLAELAHIDLEFRTRAGDAARVEDYIQRFPELASPDVVLDLITTEFALRNRHRPPAWPEEYFLRFPLLLPDLVELLADRGGGRPTRTPVRATIPRPIRGVPAVPGYEIGAEVGRGGMGVVYQARDRALGRTVAVKTLGVAAGDEWLARFRREAESIARLDHPHIVPVYEVGEWGSAAGGAGVPYYVMKWYPGGSLEAVPTGKGTAPAAHARAVETIARAVHHAHQRGVLHRDLKPSNILLDEAGRPHVADFGLATRFDPADPRPVTAAVVGTPAYMAPEQALAPATVTTAADVYGLGAILYELLTGQPPFEEETALATLERVCNAPPRRPSAVNPRVPKDLETICLKCLEKDPAKRYASADALADDLARWRAGRPILARPTPAWEHAWRLARRHPVMALMSGLAAGLFMFAVVSQAVAIEESRRKQAETDAALEAACEARKGLLAALDREQDALYQERVASAGRLYATNQLPQAWRLLELCPPQFRGWEWHYLDGLRRAGPVVLSGHKARVFRTAFLADGRLASADERGVVKVWDVAAGRAVNTLTVGTKRVRGLAAHPSRNWLAVADAAGVAVWDADAGTRLRGLAGAGVVAFGPGGEWVAAADGATVRVWAVPSWEPRWELTGHADAVTALAFHPDGRRLLTGSADGTVRTWDLATGAADGEPWPRPRAVTGLAFTAGGAALVEAHAEGAVVVDPGTGRHLYRVEPTAADREFAAAGPHPRWVAVAGPNAEVIVWDAVGRHPARVFRGHTSGVSALAFSPDARWLASGGGDEEVRVWDLAQDLHARTLGPAGSWPEGLAVAPDGTRVAVAQRQPSPAGVRVRATAARERVVMPGCGGVAFGPDSRRLASWRGRERGEVVVWDAATGAEVWARPAPGVTHDPAAYYPDVRRVAFSPDGSWLATWSERGGGVQLWGAADGSGPEVLAPGSEEVHGHVHGLAFSPDGGRLAAAGDKATVVWDVARRAEVFRSTTPCGALAVAFSPDGKRLATAGRDRVVRVRDAQTGAFVRSLVGNPTRVAGLAFSPDGTRLVTGGDDKAVRVWHVETGKELLSLPGVAGPVTAVAWDASGRRVYALDNAVRVWAVGR